MRPNLHRCPKNRLTPLLLALLSITSTQAAELPVLSTQSQQYIQRIDALPPTGDIDHDFAAFLVPQHLTGVGLSEVEIHSGRNSQLRDIAAGILAHADRNTPVTSHVSPLTANDPRYQTEKERLQTADSHARQAFSKPLNGDTDHQFGWLMAAHHQRAIDYASAELQLGRDPTLKKMARDIISSQKQQHQLMMKVLKP